MESEHKVYQINPIIAIAVFLQILFIIFIIVTINGVLNSQDDVAKIDIGNYSSISDGVIIDNSDDINVETDFKLDDTKKSVIGGLIYQIALLNNVDNISNNKAAIRADSVHYEYIEDLKIYFLNFIVDLEDLGQSYRIVYRWADEYPNENVPTNEPAMAFCLHKDELIYENFNCKDSYNNYGESLVVYDLLRYKDFSNFTVGLSGDIYKGEALNIHINTISNEESFVSSAISEVSEYLSSLGFNLNDFEYSAGTVEIAN